MRPGHSGAGTRGRRLAVTALLLAGLTATSCSSGAPTGSGTTGRSAQPLPTMYAPLPGSVTVPCASVKTKA